MIKKLHDYMVDFAGISLLCICFHFMSPVFNDTVDDGRSSDVTTTLDTLKNS